MSSQCAKTHVAHTCWHTQNVHAPYATPARVRLFTGHTAVAHKHVHEMSGRRCVWCCPQVSSRARDDVVDEAAMVILLRRVTCILKAQAQRCHQRPKRGFMYRGKCKSVFVRPAPLFGRLVADCCAWGWEGRPRNKENKPQNRHTQHDRKSVQVYAAQSRLRAREPESERSVANRKRYYYSLSQIACASCMSAPIKWFVWPRVYFTILL